jgi:hypothetical protein
MRTLKELYQILYEHIVYDDVVSSLCWAISTLAHYGKISQEEYKILSSHFIEQRPSVGKHPQFYSHSTYNKSFWNNFWWQKGTKDSTEQRKEFIKYLIEQQ